MSREFILHPGDPFTAEFSRPRKDFTPTVDKVEVDGLLIRQRVNGWESVSIGAYHRDPWSTDGGAWQLVAVNTENQQARSIYRSARFRAAEKMAGFIDRHLVNNPARGLLAALFAAEGGKTIEPGGLAAHAQGEYAGTIGMIYDHRDMFWFRAGQSPEADLQDLATVLSFNVLCYPDDWEYWPGRADITPSSDKFAKHHSEIETGVAMLLAAAEGVKSELATKAFAALKKALGERDW